MTAEWNREEQLEILKRLDAYETWQITDMRELHTDDMVLSHKKTGAYVFLLLTDNPSKVFTISFRTPSQGSIGVAHIIEYTMFCGLGEYWAKDLSMELMKDSLNTLPNAMIHPDRTSYSVANYNPKDFEGLVNVYLDAVFHPLFYKEKKIFRQEGRRYELESEDGKLSRNGVIYNKMGDVYPDPDEMMVYVVDEALSPGCPYVEESGGGPDFIPDLVYEAYLDSRRRYCHPNNTFIYLYGDLDMVERLCYLDENYPSKYECPAIDSAILASKPLTAPVSVSCPYSVGDAENKENTAYVSLNIRVGGQLEPVPYDAFQVLDYVLLRAPGVILHDRLIEGGFEGDVYGGYTGGIREPYFRITAKYSRCGQKDIFVRRARELLTELAEDSLNHGISFATINMAESCTREASFGSYPKDLIHGPQSFESRIYDDDPCLHLKFAGPSDTLRSKVGGNYFEELIREKPLGNEKYTVTELYPVRGLTAKYEAEDTERLPAVKAAIITEKRGALIRFDKEMKAYQDAPDSEAALHTIPMFSREDFVAESTLFCYETETLGEMPFHYVMRNTTGTDYLRLDFGMSDLPVEDLSALALIKGLLGYLSMEAHSHTEPSTLVNFHADGIQFGVDDYPDLAGLQGGWRIFLISVRFLTEKVGQALDLVNEQFLQTLFTDGVRIRNLVGEICADLKDTLLSTENIAATSRMVSYFNENGLFRDVTRGTVYYRFSESLSAEFARRAFCERAPKPLRETVVRDRLLVHLTVEETDKEALLPLFRTLKEHYPAGSKGEVRFRLVKDIRREDFRSASRMNYVVRVGNFRTDGFRYMGAFRIAQTTLGYGYLWNEIRSRGGAYGYSVRFEHSGNVVFSSYRNLKLGAIDKVYKGAPAYLEYYGVDEREMIKAIIGAIDETDMPRSAQINSQPVLAAYYSRVTGEMLSAGRREVLTVTLANIHTLAPLVREALRYEVKCVIGNESIIERVEDFFTKIPQLFAKESEEAGA